MRRSCRARRALAGAARSRLRSSSPATPPEAPRARAGDTEAQFRLALRYAQGDGVAPDAAQAARWFRRAAEQGHPEAAASLGVLYSEGLGVAADPAESVRWPHSPLCLVTLTSPSTLH